MDGRDQSLLVLMSEDFAKVKFYDGIEMNEISKTNRQVWIVDTTLRDGEQAPGVVFKGSEKIELAKKLVDCGVNELEVGIPAMSEYEQKTIRGIVQKGLPVRLTSWSRALKSDIESAAKTGTEGVHISFPTSDSHLASLNKDESWVIEQLEVLVKKAKGYFEFVSVGAQDGIRANSVFLSRFIAHAQHVGADRLRIADTVGSVLPQDINPMIMQIQRHSQIHLEFHAHNDLGMATANAMLAIDAGCQAISATVCGIGERAGNVALEEIAVALSMSKQYSSTIDLSKLNRLCRYVANISGRKIHTQKPIVGEAIFQHESGIHCAALIKDPKTYQPFLPESVGNAPATYIIGKHSGSAAIRHILSQYKIEVSKPESLAILNQVKLKVIALKRSLTPQELIDIYQQFNPKNKVA